MGRIATAEEIGADFSLNDHPSRTHIPWIDKKMWMWGWCHMVQMALPGPRWMNLHPGETVVVVSHTAINRLLILGVLDISLEHFRHLGQEMTAINVLDFDGHSYTLRQMNLTEHLANLPH